MAEDRRFFIRIGEKDMIYDERMRRSNPLNELPIEIRDLVEPCVHGTDPCKQEGFTIDDLLKRAMKQKLLDPNMGGDRVSALKNKISKFFNPSFPRGSLDPVSEDGVINEYHEIQLLGVADHLMRIERVRPFIDQSDQTAAWIRIDPSVARDLLILFERYNSGTPPELKSEIAALIKDLNLQPFLKDDQVLKHWAKFKVPLPFLMDGKQTADYGMGYQYEKNVLPILLNELFWTSPPVSKDAVDQLMIRVMEKAPASMPTSLVVDMFFSLSRRCDDLRNFLTTKRSDGFLKTRFHEKTDNLNEWGERFNLLAIATRRANPTAIQELAGLLSSRDHPLYDLYKDSNIPSHNIMFYKNALYPLINDLASTDGNGFPKELDLFRQELRIYLPLFFRKSEPLTVVHLINFAQNDTGLETFRKLEENFDARYKAFHAAKGEKCQAQYFPLICQKIKKSLGPMTFKNLSNPLISSLEDLGGEEHDTAFVLKKFAAEYPSIEALNRLGEAANSATVYSYAAFEALAEIAIDPSLAKKKETSLIQEEARKGTSNNVILAKAGIQKSAKTLDSRLRGNDKSRVIRGALKFFHSGLDWDDKKIQELEDLEIGVGWIPFLQRITKALEGVLLNPHFLQIERPFENSFKTIQKLTKCQTVGTAITAVKVLARLAEKRLSIYGERPAKTLAEVIKGPSFAEVVKEEAWDTLRRLSMMAWDKKTNPHQAYRVEYTNHLVSIAESIFANRFSLEAAETLAQIYNQTKDPALLDYLKNLDMKAIKELNPVARVCNLLGNLSLLKNQAAFNLLNQHFDKQRDIAVVDPLKKILNNKHLKDYHSKIMLTAAKAALSSSPEWARAGYELLILGIKRGCDEALKGIYRVALSKQERHHNAATVLLRYENNPNGKFLAEFDEEMAKRVRAKPEGEDPQSHMIEYAHKLSDRAHYRLYNEIQERMTILPDIPGQKLDAGTPTKVIGGDFSRSMPPQIPLEVKRREIYQTLNQPGELDMSVLIQYDDSPQILREIILNPMTDLLIRDRAIEALVKMACSFPEIHHAGISLLLIINEDCPKLAKSGNSEDKDRAEYILTEIPNAAGEGNRWCVLADGALKALEEFFGEKENKQKSPPK